MTSAGVSGSLFTMGAVCALLLAAGMGCAQQVEDACVDTCAEVPVRELVWMASVAIERPDLGPVLARVAIRESKLDPETHVHAGDSWASHRVWKRAVVRGLLDPECQPDGDGWSTRGVLGLMAAYSLRYVPELECAAPEVLDHPGVSAVAAARRAAEAGDCEDVAAEWAGRKRWQERSWLKRWRKAWWVCGGMPPSLRRTLFWVYGAWSIVRSVAITR